MKLFNHQMYGAEAYKYINEQLKKAKKLSLVYYQSPCKIYQSLMFYPLKLSTIYMYIYTLALRGQTCSPDVNSDFSFSH